MFKKDLVNKYPFLCEYFESVLSNSEKNIPNSILFYGQDIEDQYKIAQEIARNLNCLEGQDEFCNCVNCRWIREKTHPAVLTISNIDSKPEDDETKKVISIKQARYVKSTLNNTFEFFRVFIFCGAKIENDKWIPIGLNEDNFKAEAANALLKIVEETPDNSIFIFLTNNISDIIPTIVSRSQTFFVPTHNMKQLNFSGIKDMFDNYPNFKSSNVFEYSAQFQNYLKDNPNIFDKCENYLLALLKSNLENTFLKQKIINDINSFERAKKMFNLGIKPKIIADDLFLTIFKR